MRRTIESVTCSCGVYLGLITSDGRGPLLDCDFCEECRVKNKLAPYQKAAKKRMKMFEKVLDHEQYAANRKATCAVRPAP
jgi:hypothetical protein